jgi:hypothetical protein
VREVVNGIMYVLSTGCQWRNIPKDLPPKSTLHDYLVRWNDDNTLTAIHYALYVQCRETMKREPTLVGTVSTLGVVRPRSLLAGVDRWLVGISVRSRSRACHCKRRSAPGAADRRRVVTSAATVISPSAGSPGNWPSPR